MTYSGIEFLPLGRLKVPIHTDLRFDTERRDVLLVQVRAIQNCSLELKEGRHVIVDAHSKVVGGLWLDITSNTVEAGIQRVQRRCRRNQMRVSRW